MADRQARFEVRLEGGPEATKGLERFAKAEERVAVGANKAAAATKQATAATQRSARGMKQADDAADILAQTIGGTLPTATRKYIAESKVLGAILKSTFSVALIGGFVAFAIPAMSRLSKKFADFFFDVEGANKRLQRQIKTNSFILEYTKQTQDLDRATQLIGKEGPARIRLLGRFALEAIEGPAKSLRRQLDGLKQELAALPDEKKRLEDLQDLQEKLGRGDSIRLQSTAKLNALADRKLEIDNEIGLVEGELQAIAKARTAQERNTAAELRAQLKTAQEINVETERGFRLNLNSKFTGEPFPGLVADRKGREAGAAQILALERQTAIQRAQINGDTVQTILLQEQLRLEQTVANLQTLGATEDQVARARAIVNQQTALKITQVNQAAMDAQRQQLEGFLQQVFLTTRSFEDVWKQFTQQLVRLFTTAVSQMVARWLLGQRQMAGASGGGGGGFLSQLFNFGGGGGGGGGASSIIKGVGGLAAGGKGLTTSAASAGGSAGSASSLAAFGGPVGIALSIGAIAGPAIFNRLTRGRRNRRAARGAEIDFNRQLASIETEFEFRRLDADQAGESIRNALNAFRETTGGLGRPGSRARTRAQARFAELLVSIDDISSARNSRERLIGSGAIPEFGHGGFTGSGGLAVVHPNEFVLNAQATRSIGRDNLERANRNPGSGGGVQIFVIINPAPGMDEEEIGRVAVRSLERAARDRGVRIFR